MFCLKCSAFYYSLILLIFQVDNCICMARRAIEVNWLLPFPSVYRKSSVNRWFIQGCQPRGYIAQKYSKWLYGVCVISPSKWLQYFKFYVSWITYYLLDTDMAIDQHQRDPHVFCVLRVLEFLSGRRRARMLTSAFCII